MKNQTDIEESSGKSERLICLSSMCLLRDKRIFSRTSPVHHLSSHVEIGTFLQLILNCPASKEKGNV